MNNINRREFLSITPATVLLGAILLFTAAPVFAVEGELTPQQIEKLLKRFPDADLNKDSRLTLDEFRQFRVKTRASAVTSSPPAVAAALAPGGD